MTNNITTDLSPLSPSEARQTRYQSALTHYYSLVAEYSETGRIDWDTIIQAVDEVIQWRPEKEESRSIREVAETTEVSPRTIRRWIAAKRIPAKRRGKLWYVTVSDVSACAAEGGKRGWPLGRARKTTGEKDGQEKPAQT